METRFESLQDKWIKCVSQSGKIRSVAVNCTELTKNFCEVHKLDSGVEAAMGEALSAALLLASYCKEGERINLNIRGDGWVKQALVDAHPDGSVRGYLVENDATGTSYSLNLGPWGEGTMSVLRTKDMERQQPYIGTVPLVTGFLPKDLTFYWLQSEQVHSAVGIAVKHDKEGKLLGAGAFMVQAMPGISKSELKALENSVNNLGKLAEEVAFNRDPMFLLSQLFGDSMFFKVEERNLRRVCNCSREKVDRTLRLLGADELESMAKTQGEATVTCEFCQVHFKSSKSELEAMAASVRV